MALSHSVNKSLYKSLFVGTIALGLSVSLAAKPLIIDDITFAENSGATDNVKQECRLPEKFHRFLSKYVKKQGYDAVEASSDNLPADADRLTISMDRVYANRGGAWSGAKQVYVIGTLTQAGKEPLEFHGQRSSTGGVFGGFKGTCSLLGRDVKSLSKDISRWLKNPSDDARLGEL